MSTMSTMSTNRDMNVTPHSPKGAPRLTISQLAALAQVTRDTLLFYDRIGLLTPAGRDANHYRYYSERELLKVNLIRTFQSLGMSLKDIRELLERRCPELVLASLEDQMSAIKKQQDQLEQARLLLERFHGIIGYALSIDEGDVALRWCDERAILIGPRNDYSQGRTIWDNILDSYRYFQRFVTPLEMNYPVWSFYEQQSVQARRWLAPDHFYMDNPRACDRRAAGWYVVGCARGGYGGSPALFERLLGFITDEGLELAGRSYVDYLLNELSVEEPDGYLIQVSIAVAGPGAKPGARPSAIGVREVRANPAPRPAPDPSLGPAPTLRPGPRQKDGFPSVTVRQ
jgi:DNA-binding transcriptional MerR regulator